MDYFPNYQGGSDVKKAAKYIISKFMQANRSHPTIYAQYMLSLLTFLPLFMPFFFFLFLHSLTIATDMTTMAPVFSAVKETIYQNSIGESVPL